MNRPCTCDQGIPESGPMPKYVYGVHCSMCYVWHTDAKVNKAWGGDGRVRSIKSAVGTPRKASAILAPECRFRGSATGETTSCKSCGGARKEIPLLECSYFKEPCFTGVGSPPKGRACMRCEVPKNATVLERVAGPAQLPAVADRVSLLVPQRQTVNLPGHFNAGMIRFNGRLLMASRLHSSIFLSELDDSFQPVWTRRLVLNHEQCRNGQEDPRLFTHRGKLCVWFTGIKGDRKSVRVNQLYAILREDFSAEVVYAPKYKDRREREKNWQPFTIGDELYAVYSIAPHVVLKLDGDKITEEHATTNLLPWSGGFLRGGTPPVIVGDRLLSFFHGNLPVPIPKRETRYVYSVGAYEFNAISPFNVTRQIHKPLLWADETDRCHGREVEVVFPCGQVQDGDDWIVSQGTRDEAVEVCRWKMAEVDAAMREPTALPGRVASAIDDILTLPGWCSRGKTEEIIRHVMRYRPAVGVEIGVFGGRSLIPAAVAMRENGIGTIYAVDPWDNAAPLEGTQKQSDSEWWGKFPAQEIYAEFINATEQFGVGDVVKVLRSKSSDASKQFAAASVDYVMIDGNHSPEVSLRDVKTWWPKLRSGGWMWFDDADWSSTQSAIKWLQSKCVEHETRVFINEDGLGGRTGIFRKP